MASEQQPAAAAASPQLVGNAFVNQYYHILHKSPELVHRFYQDISKLGRPDAAGSLSSVTTMEAINEKILSLEYGEHKSEIRTVDAHESYNGGVLVLVTGYLTGKDNIKRNFTQSFFLAPQDRGYFVLNDIFRYVEADDQQQPQPENQETDESVVPPSHEDDFLPTHEQQIAEQTASPPEEEEEPNVEEVYNPSENEEDSVVDEEASAGNVVNEVQSCSQAEVDTIPVTVQEDVPKKSYAYIVKAMKENASPLSVPAASPARSVPVNPPHQVAAVPVSSSTPEVPVSGSCGPENGDVQEAEVDGYSIYIKNLPLNAIPQQLEEEFKRFGPIKPGGIQVRSNKQQGFCFGFVEFEVASAVQSAIEASPIAIGGRHAYVEEKRPSGSRASTRGRFTPGRGGGFRGDGLRGRTSYGVGRGYGRPDFNNKSDFGSRSGGRGGASGRVEAGYQRVDHLGSNGARTNRTAGLPVSASAKIVSPRVPAPA